MANLQANFNEPFDKQVEFFRAKLGNQVPTDQWDDMLGAAHDKAFTVAGAMKADLLADLAGAVDKALFEGGTLETFRADFAQLVKKHGWNYNGDFNWRTKTIYMTNLRTSYAAGRLEQLQGYDYWVYKHSDVVSNPRLEHKAWSGLTLSKDDPWWNSHYPPNGWGCQCRVLGVRRPEDVRRYGGQLGPAPAIVIDPKTGAPTGIDKGWDYKPGASVLKTQGQVPALADPPPQGKPAMSGPVCKLGTVKFNEDECPGPIPPARPFDASRLLRPGLEAEDYVRGFLREFGADIGRPKTFTDVQGQTLTISDELFIQREKTARAGVPVYKVLKRDRNIYLPMLAETIKDPQEIWMAPEHIMALGGRLMYRRRYLAWWELPDMERPGLAVFESIDQQLWSGVTVFSPEAENPDDLEAYLARIRIAGTLEYKKQ